MSRVAIPVISIGNEFVLPQPRIHRSTPVQAITPPVDRATYAAIIAAAHAEAPKQAKVRPNLSNRLRSSPHDAFEAFHRHSLVAFSGLTLLVAFSGVQVVSSYYASRLFHPAVAAAKPAVKTIAGLNLTVPTAQLQAKLQTITSQSASLSIGDHTVPLSSDTIHSWLQISSDSKKSLTYIHIKSAAISVSLAQAANKYVKSPVNQVTVTHPDGSGGVIIGGTNGAKLTDPSGLAAQAQQAAKTVMDAKGLKFTTPLQTVPFQAVTPAAFSKLIEVNVVTKQMYLYDNGQLTHTYPISAGAPKTPTPIGEYKTYAKFATQDMKGFNADGTKYLQPHVHWISYFLPGGYAIHGNYWRPASWFGVINSSHGCVSLPDTQAKEVYDWTPVGTTVITHV